MILGLYTSRYWRIKDPYVFFEGALVSRSKLPNLVKVDGGFVYTPFGRPWLRSLDVWMRQHFWLGAHTADLARGAYWQKSKGESRVDPTEVDNDALDYDLVLGDLLGQLELLSKSVAQADARLIVLLVADQGRDGRFLERHRVYNEVVQRKCTVLGLICVDVLPLMEARSNGRPVFRFPDDHHWPLAGHRLAADELARVIADVMIAENGEAQAPQP